MNRSGYADDCDHLGLYRASVDRALYGKRGQKFLREMVAVLDAMPVKELVADEIVRDAEHVCGLGAVALARGLDVSTLDVEDGAAVGKLLGIAESMAREIAFENDGDFDPGEETSEERWVRMRAWAIANLRYGAGQGEGGGG